MIHPWLQPSWERLLEQGERLHHALLFAGPPGLGKSELAHALAARLLCDRPVPGGEACEQCPPCQWRRAGNHPDLLLVAPESGAEASTGSEVVSGKPPRAGAGQIVIEQIRALQTALSVTAHHRARRVIVIEPAQAMNIFTANALLKLLEEPPAAALFILVTSSPRQLLPTIRSRCQSWNFARPSAHELDQWQQSASVAQRALLGLSGGLPLAAERMAARGLDRFQQRFVDDLSSLSSGGALQLAAQWESWLKSKEAQAADFGVVELVQWMLCWVSDLAVMRLGGRLRFFAHHHDQLRASVENASIAALSGCYNTMLQIRKVARHPLNLRLFLEDMLLRYAAALPSATDRQTTRKR